MSSVSDVAECSRCAYCSSVCPSFAIERREGFNARGRLLIGSLKETKASPSLTRYLFSCTLCKACEEVCPVGIKVTDAVMKARERLVKLEAELPTELQKSVSAVHRSRNLFGQPQDWREAWRARAKPADVLFFTGCYASFKKPQILEAASRTLTAAGLAYTALGAHESCCGFPVYVAGDDKAEALMRDNATRFQAAGASKVVTACAKCYWMLKEVYPKYAKVDLEVSHAVEVLRELLDEGRLKPRKLELWISYHDPCFLSRYIDLCDDARDILEKIPGIKFVEMAHNKRNSLCCGAGGGVLMTFKDLALKLGRRRIEEALEVEADLLVTSCPFCYANLSEAGRSSLLPVGDIFELVASVL